MYDRDRQPNWWLLFLALPLACVLFWLIQRAHLAGTERGLLDMGALLLVGGYLEAWQVFNTLALMRHPLAGGEGQPIYYAREAAALTTPETGGQPARVIGHFYSELFPLPVQVPEPWSAAPEPSGREAVS